MARTRRSSNVDSNTNESSWPVLVGHAAKWQALVDLCSKTSIVFDRTDYRMVADLQDAIMSCPWIDLHSNYAKLDRVQRGNFVFIAGLVLDSNTFTSVMKITTLQSILDERDAEIGRLNCEIASLKNQVAQYAKGQAMLREHLDKIAELANTVVW